MTFTEHWRTASAPQRAAGVGWIFAAIATGMVVPTALQGIRARITDNAPWTMPGPFWAGGVAGRAYDDHADIRL